MTYLELYIRENNSEQKWIGVWGTSVKPLEKPAANGNSYSRAGTAELKP
jgi:hypothetical protein